MRWFYSFICLFLFGQHVSAQQWDTLKVMTYNILYYGEITSFCDNNNNNINDKDVYFKTIAKYVQPDILVVQEMGASVVYANRIIEKVLNTDGTNRFRSAPIQNNGFSSLVNGVFYDKNKLVLHKQEKVTQAMNNTSLVRAIDICTFYYKDPNLEEGRDTAFFSIAVMHLKAGSSTSDADERDLATEALMERISSSYPEGYFLAAGDFNMSSSNEQGFQNLISIEYGSHRFKDPLVTGGWSNSSAFAYTHTQSTHTSGGCHSGGGLDDRFDMILMSAKVLEDSGQVGYVSESYTAVGNDGLHFNQSILQGTNSSVPSTVLGALYEMSDHLPVTADIRVRLLEPQEDTIPSAINETIQNRNWEIYLVDRNVLFRGARRGDLVTVYDLYGRSMMRTTWRHANGQMDLSNLAAGMYVIEIQNGASKDAFKIALP